MPAFKLSRRALFRWMLGAGAGSVVLGTLGYRFVERSAERAVEEIVRHYIGDEHLAPGAAARFARDFSPQATAGKRELAALALTRWLDEASREALPGRISGPMDAVERRIITVFIQSSDMTERPEALRRPIDYVTLTIEPMCNPFARLRA